MFEYKTMHHDANMHRYIKIKQKHTIYFPSFCTMMIYA